MDAYGKFADYVLNVETPPPGEFLSLCRRLRISPADVDEAMEEELGMSGEEFLSACRKCV